MWPEQIPNNADGSTSFADLMQGMASFQRKNLTLQIKLVAPGQEELGPYIINEELTQTQADGSMRTVPVETSYVSTANGCPIFPSSEMRQVWLSYCGRFITSTSLRGVCASRYHEALVGANHNFLLAEELTPEQMPVVDRRKQWCPKCRGKEKRRSRRNTIITICAVIGFFWLLGKVPPDWLPKDPGPPAGVEQQASPSRSRK